MSGLTRTQKIILLVLAVADVVVIGGMAAVILSSMRAAAQPAPTATADVVNTPIVVATWTPTPTLTPRPTMPARLTNTPTATATPHPTMTPTATATATPIPQATIRVTLEGANFDYLLPNRIPGWTWDAYVNYKPGDPYDPETSYAEPVFTAADDPARQIDGTTLKVETMRWLRFRAWVHQTVTVTAGSAVSFQIRAKAFSSLDSLIVKAGIDPRGAGNCHGALWGQELRINQDSGIVTLTSPRVIAAAIPPTPEAEDQEGSDEEPAENQPALGRVTVCFSAEPSYPHINNAAFFDQASLTVAPPR